MPLNNGEYGILGFNNMIPVPACALIPFDISDIEDTKYASLLRHQASFINKHKSDVYHRAGRTYFLATSKDTTGTEDTTNFYRRVCCNFKKLERMADRYNPNYQHKKRT